MSLVPIILVIEPIKSDKLPVSTSWAKAAVGSDRASAPRVRCVFFFIKL